MRAELARGGHDGRRWEGADMTGIRRHPSIRRVSTGYVRMYCTGPKAKGGSGGRGQGVWTHTPLLCHDVGFLTLGPKLDPRLAPFFLLVDLIWTPPPLSKILDPPLGPYPGLTGGGGDARHRCSGRPRRVWGHAPPEFFFINLIEYGVSFCIVKYKSLSLYL